MPQIFRPSANAIAVWVIGTIIAGSLSVAVAGTLWTRSTFNTDVGRPVTQPVPFSHEHHVGGLGIDCRYCHSSVETSATAGLPATEVCMTCHSQLWTNAGVLTPVRQSLARNAPIAWSRVNQLGDFVFFNHSAHVNVGVACVTCHGPIDRMPLTWRENPMQMSWCLDCHRNPTPHLSPQSMVFDPDAKPGGARPSLNLHDIERLTDCYVCHR